MPEGGEVDLEALSREALFSVSIDGPLIETSPSADRQLYTQVPTWLWLEPGWWEPYEATARAGRVWSTVRATPVSTTRSKEHTSELQSLMRISYAVFCLKKKTTYHTHHHLYL